MNRQKFVTAAAALSVLTGAVALLAPAQAGALFGVDLDNAALWQTRLLGASYLGYAVITWLARDVRDEAAQRAVALGSVASWAISTVVIASAVVARVAGPQTWALVAVAFFTTAAWAYVAVEGRAAAAPAVAK